MAYIGNSPGVASQRIVTTFTATSNQTTFTPQSGYTVGYIDVYHNGVRLVNGDDYTASNGTTVVLASGAAADDVVETVAYLPRGLSDGYTKAEADARYMSINEETLPSQTGNSGEFLTTDGTNASWATVDKTTVGLSNVENKSSETIRGEITSGNVTTGLGYTPVNKAGDTMIGQLNLNYPNPRISMSDTGGSSRSINIGHWDGTNNRIETNAAPFLIAMYGTHSFRVENATNGGSFAMDAYGRVTMPYQPAFLAVNDSTTASDGTINSAAAIDFFKATKFNIGGHFNTSNSTFTAPVAGRYHFNVMFSVRSNTSVQIVWMVNGAQYSGGTDVLVIEGSFSSGASAFHPSGGILLNLSAGDTVRLNNRGGAFNVGRHHSHFYGHLIG